MSPLVLALQLVHVLGATVLLGSGIGIAFVLAVAHRSRDPRVIAPVAQITVAAGFIFTLLAVLVQPVSGAALALAVGYPLTDSWIALSMGLYLLVGLCWLPALWLQIQMESLARGAADSGAALPERYHRLYRIWAMLGWPGFGGVIAIYALMIAKPVLW